MKTRKTTQIGYINRNNQKVIKRTEQPGNDFAQKIYILSCGDCRKEYGANGSDIWQRKCPECQGGAPGI